MGVSAWSIYKVFDTADDSKVFIGIISEKHWERFCDAFGWKDWLEDERLATNNGRIDEREWFIPALDERVKQHTKADIISRCDGAHIPFAPIARPEDLSNDPQLNEGLGLLPITMPNGQTAKLPKFPIEYGDAEVQKIADPPAIGEHTEAILMELGYTSEVINALKKEQNIAT